MHCVAALDAPTSGRVDIDGVDICGLKDKSLLATKYRAELTRFNGAPGDRGRRQRER
ncbi:MAG: hypothetical protein QOK30_2491 [Nocardioidaceae bacterium]|jgi:ABC-type lipoprotein export system ATPase subunit|nr:hypothetical protein [Nocardioidaceae bacterium]